MHVVRLADAGLAVSSIRVALAAIRTAHLLAGRAIDLRHPRLAMGVEGITRSRTRRAKQESAIPCGTHPRLVETLQAWLTAAAVAAGPVFRPITKGGQVGRGPLGNDGFIRALKRRVAASIDRHAPPLRPPRQPVQGPPGRVLVIWDWASGAVFRPVRPRLP
jgi:hypothetical protein